jgi:hypothetical protein
MPFIENSLVIKGLISPFSLQPRRFSNIPAGIMMPHAFQDFLSVRSANLIQE